MPNPAAAYVIQGDLLSMFLYAVGSLLLINAFKLSNHQSTQAWYANDASAVGDLSAIQTWFDSLLILGPKFGYFPEPQKSCLVVKESILPEAYQLFNNLDIKITTSSRFLRGVVGDSSGIRLPTESPALSYSTSRSATEVLTNAIKFNTLFTPYDCICQVHLSMRDHSNVMRKADNSTFSNILRHIDTDHQRLILRSKDSLSSWLSVILTIKDNFDLSCTEFRDAICLRYSKPLLERAPS
uniref:Uncharacterized protein n=1 Tax=Amphimedon queenslandica TaxID=400682 RepID=A0A1X7TTT9_AMPQE